MHSPAGALHKNVDKHNNPPDTHAHAVPHTAKGATPRPCVNEAQREKTHPFSSGTRITIHNYTHTECTHTRDSRGARVRRDVMMARAMHDDTFAVWCFGSPRWVIEYSIHTHSS